MAKKSCYLAGAIHGDPDPVSWRKQATLLLKDSGWNVVDPIHLEVNLAFPEGVVRTDLKAIRACQRILARCDRPSWGTAMEIRDAWIWSIPTIAWIPGLDNLENVSPWLKYHTRSRTNDLTEAVRRIVA